MRWIYPPTPIKTICWIPAVTLAVFAIASMVNPDFFNQLASKTPITNGTFTNCTFTFTNVTITNNTTCVVDAGVFLEIFMLSYPLFPLVFAEVATLLHYIGAEFKAAESLQDDNEALQTNFNF